MSKQKPRQRIGPQGGRPTRYDPTYHPQLAKWMMRAGLTIKELAEEFGVADTTVYAWMQKHEEFALAMKESGNFIDSLVEDSLLKRALGYTVEELDETIVEKGNNVVEVRTRRNVRHIPPDVTAITFWLKNRQPARWRDRVDVETVEEKEIKVVLGIKGLDYENT